MKRIRMLAGMIGLGATACMTSPTDGQRVGAAQSLPFQGVAPSPNQTIIISAVCQTNCAAQGVAVGALKQIATAVSASGPIATSSDGYALYQWSTSAVIPAWGWAFVPPQVHKQARVVAALPNGGQKLASVNSDWLSCWTQNGASVNNFEEHCTSKDTPYAVVTSPEFQDNTGIPAPHPACTSDCFMLQTKLPVAIDANNPYRFSTFATTFWNRSVSVASSTDLVVFDTAPSASTPFRIFGGDSNYQTNVKNGSAPLSELGPARLYDFYYWDHENSFGAWVEDDQPRMLAAQINQTPSAPSDVRVDVLLGDSDYQTGIWNTVSAAPNSDFRAKYFFGYDSLQASPPNLFQFTTSATDGHIYLSEYASDFDDTKSYKKKISDVKLPITGSTAEWEFFSGYVSPQGYTDVVAVQTQHCADYTDPNTCTSQARVVVLSWTSGWTKIITNYSIPIPTNGTGMSDYKFLVSPYYILGGDGVSSDSLWAIKYRNTASGHLELSILNPLYEDTF